VKSVARNPLVLLNELRSATGFWQLAHGGIEQGGAQCRSE